MGQPEFILHGDAEAAVVDILKNDTPELPHFPPNPPLFITTTLVGYDSGQRRIVVTQEGAMEIWPKISKPRIDVEVFAERRSITKDIAEICLASLKRSMGDYRGFGLFLSDVNVEQGITRIPDKLQEESRYLFSVRLTVVPSLPSLQVAAS